MMKTHQLLVGSVLLLLMLWAPSRGLAQPASDELKQLHQELESLKAGQKAIRDDLQEIKKLLSSRGDPRSPIRDINLTMTVTDGFAEGDKQAALTLVEFTDYQ